VSFLRPSGKPAVYHMQSCYAAATPNIVESKSFKLYLNAWNDVVVPDLETFRAAASADLAACTGGPVDLTFFEPERSPAPLAAPGLRLDDLQPVRSASAPEPGLLRLAADGGDFAFHSHLLRSNCPVTHQPDWGSVIIQGRAERQPEPASLLTYLLSYRQCQDFHESCCERIFSDLCQRLQPERLEVRCCYTRRGGLDINPCRATDPQPAIRTQPLWRQ